MHTSGALTEFLARYYGERAVTLHPLVQDGGKRLYRIARSGPPDWLLRIAPPQSSPADFRDDAAVLAFLERRGYPAPRIVPTRDGATVARWRQCPALVTTFIAGMPTAFAPARLGQLGETLGRFHALSPPISAGVEGARDGPGPLPAARMLPRTELAAARSWLDEVRDRVPRAYRARYEVAAEVCRNLDLPEDLPTTLIHNDCHPGNSVQQPDGRVVLIDWEGAGRGPAIVDLGFLLVSCEITAFGPNRLAPDPGRLAAIIAGYCRHHRLTARELARLAEAIRFRAIVACAGGLRRMVREGRAEDGADWAWARFAAADALAARAGEHVARLAEQAAGSAGEDER